MRELFVRFSPGNKFRAPVGDNTPNLDFLKSQRHKVEEIEIFHVIPFHEVTDQKAFPMSCAVQDDDRLRRHFNYKHGNPELEYAYQPACMHPRRFQSCVKKCTLDMHLNAKVKDRLKTAKRQIETVYEKGQEFMLLQKQLQAIFPSVDDQIISLRFQDQEIYRFPESTVSCLPLNNTIMATINQSHLLRPRVEQDESFIMSKMSKNEIRDAVIDTLTSMRMSETLILGVSNHGHLFNGSALNKCAASAECAMEIVEQIAFPGDEEMATELMYACRATQSKILQKWKEDDALPYNVASPAVIRYAFCAMRALKAYYIGAADYPQIRVPSKISQLYATYIQMHFPGSESLLVPDITFVTLDD